MMTNHFLCAEWNNLIMANYIVPQEVILPYLPNKTEPDLFCGKTFLSLVAFMFLNTTIKGFAIPYHINFEEVNLRFYVKHCVGMNLKRGTVFIKEIVPRHAISFIANTFFREKYVTMKMKHSIADIQDAMEVNYEWRYYAKWNKLAATYHKKSNLMGIDSEEEFIAEHYWGFTKYDDTTTYQYEVSHPRWEVFPVIDYKVDCDFGKIYGKEFSFLNETKPASVLVAKGSQIRVHHKQALA